MGAVEMKLELEPGYLPVRGRAFLAGREERFEGWADLVGLVTEAVGGTERVLEDLTPAQRRAADLVLTGLSNREIAEHLVVSPRTVQRHLNEVFKRAGVTSRFGLMRAVFAPGMGISAHRNTRPIGESSVAERASSGRARRS